MLAFAFSLEQSAGSAPITQSRVSATLPLGVPAGHRMMLHGILFTARYRVGAGIFQVVSDQIYADVFPVQNAPPGLVSPSSASTVLGVGLDNVLPITSQQMYFNGVEVLHDLGDMQLNFDLMRNGFVGTDLHVHCVVLYEFLKIGHV
jgi:hypothetical protein